MTRAVIITSYLDYPVDIPGLLRDGDTVICLDGGYDIAAEQGIKPDILLGDFDSIKAEIPDDKEIQVLKYPSEKDFSDLELAFRLLDPRDYPEILIVGGIGGRQDQTAINMHLVTRYSRPDIKGKMIPPAGSTIPDDYSEPFKRIDILDGRNHCFAVHGADFEVLQPAVHGADFEVLQPDETPQEPATLSIPAEPDSYLSLIPMTDFCEGVTLKGVKYPLEKATLRRGSSLSISNEFEGDAATISIQKGSLLVCITAK